MIWRACYLSHFISTRTITNSAAATPVRLSSTLRRTNPDIATILSTSSAFNEHTITAVGSVRTVRNQKQRSFVELGDGSTIQSLQAVLEPAQAEGLGTGTSVEIIGAWRPAPPGKEQTHELKAESVRILGSADAKTYPIQKKYQSAEYLRTLPHLRLRTPLNALLARIRSESDFVLASFFRNRHFVRLQPPIITSSDCEGAGEVFSVSPNTPVPHVNRGNDASTSTADEYFKDPKFLTVSSQLHLEAFVHEHPGVWTLSPTFRAERSDTPRHVSEFWMLEVELRTESLEDVMDLVEEMIRSLSSELQNLGILQDLVAVYRREGGPDRLEGLQFSELLDLRWKGLAQPSWPRITYDDAVQVLRNAENPEKASFQYEPSWSRGLQLEHERYIARVVGQGSPVFVTDYPQDVKPFYMLPSSWRSGNDRISDATVACFDLLLPEVCEVVGGSLREHRLQNLAQSMHSRDMDALPSGRLDAESGSAVHPSMESSNLNWYVDLRRYGSVPHGGFGLGFDRLLGYLAGIGNIKDVVPWPRYYGRCDC